MRSRADHEGRHRRTHQEGFEGRHHAYTRELFEASFLEAGITDGRSLHLHARQIVIRFPSGS